MRGAYFFFIIMLICCNIITMGNTATLWKNAEQAKNDGLPKTAIEYLDQIILISVRDNLQNDWLKAVTEKIVLESVIQGNKPFEKIILMKKEITDAGKPLDTMLRIILARWYWHYYNENRWRFMGRSRTQDMDNDDIETWDLHKLYTEIDSLYQDILTDKDDLLKISLDSFISFLESGLMHKNLRPTLYDFAAWEAITFYSYPEFNITRPVDAFEIDSGSDAFSDYRNFIKYSPHTGDTDSPVYKALLLFQSLLNVHIGSGNIPALIDTDIERLIFIKNNSFGEIKDDIFIKRLDEIIDIFPDYPIVSKAYHQIALTFMNKNDLVNAIKYARTGYGKYPDTPGGINCRALINQIESKSLSIKSEHSVPEGKTRISVQYKNFERLHVRVIERDWDEFINENYHNPGVLPRYKLKEMLSQKPLHEWTEELCKTEDYQLRETEIELPALSSGFYWILASYDKDFMNSTQLQSNFIWVSNITLISRTEGRTLDGFILEANYGKPVNNAEVILYSHDNTRRLVVHHRTLTNADGYYIFEGLQPYRSFFIYSKKGNDQIFSMKHLNLYDSGQETLSQRTVFFTDRAIYRPGQTIYFKGICVNIDNNQMSYKTLPRRSVKIVFNDPNGKEIHSLSLKTNDFGSFSGNFTAPSDRLLGAMRIISHNPYGETTIRVEEYKRPRFYVEFDKLEGAYSLNDNIIVTGRALAYTGSPVDKAQVRYRVLREPRYPFWWSYYFPSAGGSAQEIKNGTINTDSMGRFNIEFTAMPDQKVPFDPNISFRYSVYADITDTAGETRSSTTAVSIGHRTLYLNIKANDYIIENEEFELSLASYTLNGEFFPTKGKIRIYKLKEPDKPVPARLWDDPDKEAEFGANWATWPLDKELETLNFDTEKGNPFKVAVKLGTGLYKIEASGTDTNGKEINAFLPLIISPRPERKTFPIKLPFYTKLVTPSVNVGESFKMIWGTGYKNGSAFVEITTDKETIKSYWTKAGETQHIITCDIIEKYRGGLMVSIFFIHENRNYTNTYRVHIPWDNKDIDIKFETFRDTLLPGEHETWKLNLKPKKGTLKEAEMVAALYDSSLDAFVNHLFPSFNFFKSTFRYRRINFANNATAFSYLINEWNQTISGVNYTYTSLPYHIIRQFFYYEMLYRTRYEEGAVPAPSAMADSVSMGEAVPEEKSKTEISEDARDTYTVSDEIADSSKEISVRTDLRETSFFYPHLIMNPDKSVTIDFQIGESLTKWKFLGFAHNNECMSGNITEYAVTKKDIMIQPNAPRFLRENDILEFTATLVNTTDEAMQGRASLLLLNYFSGKDITKDLMETGNTISLLLEPNSSSAVSWRLSIPKDCPPIEFTATALTSKHSDGEKGVIPVLSSRIFLTESIPLHIRGKETKEFILKSLGELDSRKTLEPFRLTVEMSSNPTWYAIQALPYLIDYPYQCSEQVFNRIYANFISGQILNSNPDIERIFDLWRSQPDSLKSNLEKNQELKSLMLEETPWLVDAKNESESKKNLALYFDRNYISGLHSRSMKQLVEMQLSDGSFPWFPGGRSNIFITLYIMSGFGRLRSMGMEVDDSLIQKGINYIDNWLSEVYSNIINYEENHLSSMIAIYLYARSFYFNEYPVSKNTEIAFQYFKGQAIEYWLTLNSRMNQAQIALALHRLKDKTIPAKIMASIKERSVYDNEMGMFWREDELSLWWYRAPIETQALVIEAFDEIMQDNESVENCKVWLLKQKQTTHWKTTKATADAVYALILIGEDWLESTDITKVMLGTRNITPASAEPGTGYYKIIIPGNDIIQDFSRITVKREEKGISWGGVHFQYFEDIANVKSHKTNLVVDKKLFIQSYTDKGIVIKPLENQTHANVGDTLIVRITIRTDRDMEYVHLKDYRGSGFEPVDVLSLYRYQDGLRYYQTTRDTASHFFIDYLPKGIYVFEYSLKTQHRGTYQTGIAEIMCMYAPEFNSHSESIVVTVK